MSLFRNQSGQKILVYAWNRSSSDAKTGDAANITAYLSLDGGAAQQTNDVNPTELDSTNLSGWYVFILTQAETDAATILISAVSSTPQIRVDDKEFDTVGIQAGYSNGAIWVNTNISNTGTEPNWDGTASNPVSTWAAALTLSSSLGIKKFDIANGSSITLSANSDNYILIGQEWSLDLNGQSCDDASFQGAHVEGMCTGGEVVFRDCDLAHDGSSMTVAGIEAHNCGIMGVIVLSAANTYYFDQCYSGVAGTGIPCIDFSAGVGDQNLNIRHYSGGIEIENMGDNGTDLMSLEGFGQLVINANCDGGTIAIRGNFTVTDNAGGNVTLSDDARYASTNEVPGIDTIISDIAALPTASENTTNLMAHKPTAGGVTTYQDIIIILHAMANGKMAKSGDTYIVYDDDNTTVLFTFTLTSSGRTIS